MKLLVAQILMNIQIKFNMYGTCIDRKTDLKEENLNLAFYF